MNAAIPAQDLARLRQAMFLGLARQPLAVPAQLQSLIGAAPAQERPLTVLALAGQRQRFERPAAEGAADAIPEAAQRLHQDPRPHMPEPARRALLRLASGVEKALADAVVSAAVRRAARAGFRPHPFDLPLLMPHIKGDARCLGLAERAYLALAGAPAKGDTPSLLHNDIRAENWTEFPKAHRIAFLREHRRKGPAIARALLKAIFAAEPAAARADLLAAFDVGLGAGDLPFLESLAKDRAESVRGMAAQLIARVPDTPAYASRLAEAARCFSRSSSSAGPILKHVGLAGGPAVVFKPPAASAGERSAAVARLFDGFSVAEIAAAARIGSAEVIGALPMDEGAVWLSLSNRAARDGDEETMVRIVECRLSSIEARSPAHLLAWLADNLTGPLSLDAGTALLRSPAWQAVLQRLGEAATPAAMKDDGTLVWTAALLPPALLTALSAAIAELQPLTVRSARDFTELALALEQTQRSPEAS